MTKAEPNNLFLQRFLCFVKAALAASRPTPAPEGLAPAKLAG